MILQEFRARWSFALELVYLDTRDERKRPRRGYYLRTLTK